MWLMEQLQVIDGKPGAWLIQTDNFQWLSASTKKLQMNQDLTAVLRAEHFTIADNQTQDNVFPVHIKNVDYLGMSAHYLVETDFGVKLELFGSVGKKPLSVDEVINICISPDNIVLL